MKEARIGGVHMRNENSAEIAPESQHHVLFQRHCIKTRATFSGYSTQKAIAQFALKLLIIPLLD